MFIGYKILFAILPFRTSVSHAAHVLICEYVYNGVSLSQSAIQLRCYFYHAGGTCSVLINIHEIYPSLRGRPQHHVFQTPPSFRINETIHVLPLSRDG